MGGGKTKNVITGGQHRFSQLRGKITPPAASDLLTGAELRHSLNLPDNLDTLVAELQSSRSGKSANWWRSAEEMIAELDQQQLERGMPYHLTGKQVFFLFTDRVLKFTISPQGPVERESGKIVGPARPGQLDYCAAECQIAAVLFSRYSNTQELAEEYKHLAAIYQRKAKNGPLTEHRQLPEVPEW